VPRARNERSLGRIDPAFLCRAICSGANRKSTERRSNERGFYSAKNERKSFRLCLLGIRSDALCGRGVNALIRSANRPIANDRARAHARAASVDFVSDWEIRLTSVFVPAIIYIRTYAYRGSHPRAISIIWNGSEAVRWAQKNAPERQRGRSGRGRGRGEGGRGDLESGRYNWRSVGRQKSRIPVRNRCIS